VQKAAYVYIRTTAIYVFSLAYTRNGLTLEKDNVRVLRLHVAAVELGWAALAALDEYETNVPEVLDYARYLKRVPKKVGYTGQRQFGRGTRMIGLQVVDGQAWVIPTKPYGRGGYLGLYERDYPDRGIVRCELEPRMLGEAIHSRSLISVPHQE
jgi:hypothetical protein